MSEHRSDGKKEHASRVAHHLRSGGCRMARGGSVAEQENEKSFDKEVREVSGKSKKAAKPEFKRGGHKASGKKPHHRLDRKARGGETKYAAGGAIKLKKGGKAEKSGGPKINIVVAPHPQGAPQPGLGAPPPQGLPPRPPMAAPPPGMAPPGAGMPPPGGPGAMMPPPRPGMARGGKAEDGGNEKKGYYSAGGSTKEYKGEQEDLGAKSMDQESNEDVNTHPPKRKAGGSIPHKAMGGPAGMVNPGMLAAIKNKRMAGLGPHGPSAPMMGSMKRGGKHAARHPKSGRFVKGGTVHPATPLVSMEAGAGGGLGRIEKAKKYGAKHGEAKH